nr:hypothetical protein GCM10020093_054610 [Planobispora longispora]
MQQARREPGLLEDPGDGDAPETAVRGSGLRITALPRASAGATERMPRISGKLNGAITPTTPTGTRRARLSRRRAVGRISPGGWEASAAAS